MLLDNNSPAFQTDTQQRDIVTLLPAHPPCPPPEGTGWATQLITLASVLTSLPAADTH